MKKTADRDVLDIRADIVQYLKNNGHGRQGLIAAECGITRTHLNRYINGAAEVCDVLILAELQRWVARDMRRAT